MEYLVTAILTWLLVMLFAPGKRRVAGGTEPTVLTYKAAFIWVMRVCWIFPVVIAVIAMVDPPNKGEGWIVFAIIGGFTALALPTTLELERRRVLLDAKGIRQESAWSSPIAIAWTDVRDVKTNMNGVVITPRRGKTINVSVYLNGMVTLADMLEEHLSALKTTAKVVSRLRTMHDRYAEGTRPF